MKEIDKKLSISKAKSPSNIEKKSDAAAKPPRPTVVGIGASAGGLAALKILLGQVPENSGIAFVIVVHLAPEQDSYLSELLQPYCAIPIQQVQAEVTLEPNQVYIIPPGVNLDTIDSHLRISKLEEERRHRAPVDHFFRKLACSHDSNAIAVILTGTGADGTLGIQEIKNQGGLTIVQDPAEAEYDGMPLSALSTGIIDLILPLRAIIENIIAFIEIQPRLFTPDDDTEDARPILKKILTLVRSKIGSDFTRYKQSTIMRRIRRRMQLSHLEELNDYLALLQDEPEEIAALANDLLINITSFFRDQSVFEEFERKIIPNLFKDKQASDSVRIWSVGYATGEEAYSLAMLLVEHASTLQSPPQIQIFASDLHEHSLKKAREGLYPGDIETDVSHARLNRFFHKENASYRIKSEVRDLIVFSPHNLLVDPPFSKVDAIVCRNVLIYLQRSLQPAIIELFHYALKPQGYLVLGTAESTNQSDLFVTENKANGIYQKLNIPTRELRLPVFPLTRQGKTNEIGQLLLTGNSSSYSALHQRLLERYAKPSILVNTENKIVHLSSNVGRYLIHPGGIPTTTVFKVVHEKLQGELCSLLHIVAERSQPCISRPVKLEIDGKLREVIIQALQDDKDKSGAFTLITFDERDPSKDEEASQDDRKYSDIASRELEVELNLTKRRLQTAIDEYEISQEEMRASNEELQSANEELRSTLEELETSKEELQSINEELQTANQENRHKVAELGQLSDDLQHLMAATHIATLFLDRKLRILRFTPQIGELFNLRSVDRGRPLSDLTHRLHYGELIDDAADVLQQLIPTEREVEDTKGNWYLARMRPYRTADDHIDGIVLTFVDITARKASENALRESEARYRALFEAMDEGFCVVEQTGSDIAETDFRILAVNPAFQKLTGLPDYSGQYLKDVAPQQLVFWRDIYHRLNSQAETTRFECPKSIFNRNLEVYSFRLPDIHSPHLAVLLKDIQQQKCNEAALKESARRDAFRLALSDALRTTRAPDEAKKISCRMLGEYLNINTLTYIELDSQGQVVSENGYVEPDVHAPQNFYPWLHNTETHQKFFNGQILHEEDTSELPPLASTQQSINRSFGVRAYVSIPILQEQQLLAALHVAHSEPRHWSEADITLIREVAERTCNAIERARAEQAIHQRELQLREAARCKNEFMAVLSHELRNPLAPILNALYIIENGKPSKEAADTAHIILKRQIGLMAGLVDDLLDITRIEQGKIQLKTRPIELNKLVARTVKDHASIFENGEIHFNYMPAKKEIWINADENRLSQAIGNLLQNCAKFTPAKGSTSISLSTKSKSALIRVADTGVGMSAELLENLFQPFIQGETNLDRSKGGLGLGLALSKRLIELHKGSITAHSDGPGKGAEFEILLPQVSPEKSQAPIEPSDAQKTIGRILIIEDNIDSANTLRDVLQLSGYDTSVTYDGATGIQLIHEQLPAIVICDIGLPGTNGYEIARHVRTDKSLDNISLIALSGYAMSEDIDRAIQAGFNYHLAKPAEISELEEIFNRI
ncbi:MAG TPA: CheR family methyltransferase, partial [Cellvibrio sp.]|nr:CheR family methyltransferase [Cellvibrio sp.]